MADLASNVNTLKCDNRALILNHIRKQPMSRSQLSKQTKLSKSAVTMITNELINEGQLVEIGTSVSCKGRKPITLDIIKDYRYAIGVLLHRKRMSVSITNLKSELIDCVEENTGNYSDYREALLWICRTIRSVINKNNIPISKIIGIGVSSPGPLDYHSGTILLPPNFDLFHNVPVVPLLKEEFDLPVFLENNSVLLAITEYFNGSMKEYKNSMFVIISDGIGSCIVINGQIFRGFGGYAGELGHTSIDINGPICSCSNRGCLELYTTLSALQKKFSFDSYEKVVDDAYSNMPEALAILEFQANCLACALISAVNLLDLDSVILFGEFNYRPELLLSKLNVIINERSLIKRAHQVKVVVSELGSDAVTVSSTAAVLSHHFNQKLL
jgi:predicted NBD/HSP70 family sugar kinase